VGKHVYSANVGDGRAIVIGDRGIQQLTVDHRIDNPEERERIRKMGGQTKGRHVYREGWWLMPTRTIGDEWFKPVGIIATPFVSKYKILETDVALIAACDGLFDVMANEEIAKLASRFPQPESCLEALRDEVLYNRRGRDNLTMIAVFF
jgi:serine/threonine protein phosphatase PrpC